MFNISKLSPRNDLILLGTYIISWLSIYSLDFKYSSLLFIGLWIGYIIYSIKYISRSLKVSLTSRFNLNTFFYGIVFGVLQISIYMGFGVFYGLGYSPYSHLWYMILFNIFFFLTPLFARELYRLTSLGVMRRKNIVKKMIFTAIYLGLLSIPLPSYNVFSGVFSSRVYLFIVSMIIPSIAYNLVASYLMVYGGIFSSFIYLASLELFELLSPILPNISWTLTILSGVLVPIFSILLLESFYPYGVKKRVGLASDIHFIKGSDNDKKMLYALSIMLISLWFVNGFFGFHPTVIVSDSMQPTLNKGDIVLIQGSPAKNIRTGDIIEYINNGGLRVVHRVIDRYVKGNMYVFVTKGDANNVEDGEIFSFQVQGKVLGVLPYVGWISIYAKTILSSSYRYLMEYPFYSLVIISLILSFLIIGRRFRGNKFVSKGGLYD